MYKQRSNARKAASASPDHLVHLVKMRFLPIGYRPFSTHVPSIQHQFMKNASTNIGHKSAASPVARRNITPCSFKDPLPDSRPRSSNLENRLSPQKLPSLPTNTDHISPTKANTNLSFFAWLQHSLSEYIGKVLYSYYNWRQDTLSDLQLFVVLNALVIVFGALVRRSIVEHTATVADTVLAADKLSAPPWWSDLYSILVVVLGQELPDKTQTTFPEQAFGVATGILGLASFALVLALIEQLTLEVIEKNVRRGSKVYESGHYVLLTWGESARDLNQITTMLQQLCVASAADGGAVIVVLAAHREKLELEAIFREAVTPLQRFGSQIVFRQGSPLDPGALELVNIQEAKAVIISGDYSRNIEDSDAQVLRCALLVDQAIIGKNIVTIKHRERQEKYQVSRQQSPWVVAEVQGRNAPDLLRAYCSSRVIPAPTSSLNARRYARLLQHPVIATLSHGLFDQKSGAHCGIAAVENKPGNSYRHLIGKQFGELFAYFPHALLVGVIDGETGETELNCPYDRRVKESDSLAFLRGNFIELNDRVFSRKGLLGGIKEKYREVLRAPYYVPESLWTGRHIQNGNMALQPAPIQDNIVVLICGWNGSDSMLSLLNELDHGVEALPSGSQVILLNTHSTEELAPCFTSLSRLHVEHVCCDPRDRENLSKAVDVTNLSVAVVLQDTSWAKRSAEAGAIPYSLSMSDMLRMDAVVLETQLNIRYLIAQNDCQEINIISEKLTYIGKLSFEDSSVLPLGSAVNSASYAAKFISQIAHNPLTLTAWSRLGIDSGITIQGCRRFLEHGERVSFAELQERCARERIVLLGWFRVPHGGQGLLEVTVNPRGVAERVKLREWDEDVKLVTMSQIEDSRQISGVIEQVNDSESSNGARKSRIEMK